jgi:three-Cys-motif partner protein
MVRKQSSDASVGPWAKEKLDSLEQYLEYYTTRLKNQKWCHGLYYIDAFAGPGLSPVRGPAPTVRNPLQPDFFLNEPDDEIGEGKVEFVKGSPRVALEIRNPFNRYLFIDNDPERLQDLADLKKEFGSTKEIEILPGDANEELEKVLSRGINWQQYKGLVFLDPFGMHVPWATIERLAKTKGIEVIINFPFGMAINRLLTISGEIPPAWQDRLDATFGTREWRDLVYEERTDLLGIASKVKRPDATERVLKWFSGRLQEIFGFTSSAQQLIRNTRGNPLYYLIWAGPHSAGLTGADYILGRKHARKKKSVKSRGAVSRNGDG